MRLTRAKKIYTITCAHCGQDAQVGSRPDQVYCTATCRQAAIYERKRPKPIRIDHWYCKVCGTKVMRHTNASVGMYCGRTCKQSARQAEIVKARSQVVIFTGPAEQHTKGVYVWRSGQCRICGEWFTTYGNDVTCSPSCSRENVRRQWRMKFDRRRALRKNAYVAPVVPSKVFALDAYICHLCKRKTDPTKQVPHPKAPTVDHVIPLSKGGMHEPANCRTACFLCNSRKGNGGGGEQLSLAV